MIEIKDDVRKIETCVKTVCNEQILCVKIPKLSARNLRRAAKKLRGLRAAIPDVNSKDDFEKFGICAISSESLLCRMAFELYISTLLKFKLSPMKVTLLIRATYFNDLKLLSEFSKNARYLSLHAANAEAAAQYLFENYGVAVIQNTTNADVIIDMYENNFSLHIIINDVEYILDDVEFSLKSHDIPLSNTKGVCTALLQAGRISPSDITVSSIVYVKKILDIQ